MKHPTVSVLLSVYNAEQYIAETVNSVLNQTYDDFEFLIFDDKSTDFSLNILRSFSDPRIRLFENNQNVGLTRNLVHGMNVARGKLVARMDADDVCMPHRLSAQIDYMEEHPDISVLGSAVIFFDGEGWEFVAHQPLEHEEIKCTLFFGYTMLHPSVMIRKADLEKHGLNYDPSFQFSQDHDLWTRAIRKVRFANLHEPLLRMREHAGKIGNTMNSQQHKLSNSVRYRQVEELKVKYTEHEMEAFCADDASVSKWKIEDLQCYESIIIKIFEANGNISIFEQKILVNIGSGLFRDKCRGLLIAGNSIGQYYWRSKLRHQGNTSIKQTIGLLLRTFM